MKSTPSSIANVLGINRPLEEGGEGVVKRGFTVINFLKKEQTKLLDKEKV